MKNGLTPLPSEVQIEEGQPLTFRSVLREIPGQRIVHAGELQGQPVICKSYLGTGGRARRHWRREDRGLRALAVAGIHTPELLYSGFHGASGAYLVVTGKLPEAVSLLELSATQGEAANTPECLLGLVELVARMHQQGVLQTDIHLANFLLAGGELYAVDGDGIRVFGASVSRAAASRNLVLLLAQFPFWIHQHLERLISTYLKTRNWPETERASLLRRLPKARAWRDRMATQKLYRDCTEIRVERSPTRFLAVKRAWQGEQFRHLLANPDQWVEQRREQVLKNGNSATVIRCSVDNRPLVIKRYNLKHLGHRLLRSCQRSRGSSSWANAHRLLRWGIATPQPVALIEERCGPLRGRAFFVSEYVDAPALVQLIQDQSTALGPALANRFAEVFAGLALLRRSHGDMKALNFLIDRDRLVVLDLDSMQCQASTARLRLALAEDFARLQSNWAPGHEFVAQLATAIRGKFARLGLFPFPVTTTDENR